MKNDNLVIGASLKTHRFSNIAINRLRSYGHSVKAIGLKEGLVKDVSIEKGHPEFADIDTILLYINPKRQPEYFNYLASLKPRRVIFNPGTENSDLQDFLESNGIQAVIACSLVMLSTGQY